MDGPTPRNCRIITARRAGSGGKRRGWPIRVASTGLLLGLPRLGGLGLVRRNSPGHADDHEQQRCGQGGGEAQEDWYCFAVVQDWSLDQSRSSGDADRRCPARRNYLRYETSILPIIACFVLL